MFHRPRTDETRFGFAKFLSWTSLILILVSSLAVSVFISNSVRNSLLRKQQDFALLLAENLNHQISLRFTWPTYRQYGYLPMRNVEVYDRLDMVVDTTIHGLHVEKLRIYGANRIIVYSTEKEEEGDYTSAGLAVTRALERQEHSFEISSSLSPLVALFHFNLPPETFILRTTYPLRVERWIGQESDMVDETAQPIMGVLEVTQDITEDYKSVISLQWLIILTSITSSLLMFLILASFIRRSERALTLRMQEKERLERELSQNEKLASMGRMVSSIAHEIRNPLGIISSSAELLRKRPNADDLTQRILSAIHDESRRLSKTVHDFLDYARPRVPNKERVDAAAVLDQALGFLEHELSERQVTVDRTYVPGLWMPADKDLLYRAFYNIISNALQAMPGAGTLRIAGTRTGDEIRLLFADSGTGFDPANMDKMLDPFFTTRDDGTGLGLAIVNSIVTSHGGTVTLGNGGHGGAEVRVNLPAA